jgi:hypothetical protein
MLQEHGCCSWAEDNGACVVMAGSWETDPGLYVVLELTTTLLGGIARSTRRLFLLDCDGTLQATSNQDSRPSAMVLDVLSALCRDDRNTVFVISGRGRKDLEDWLGSVVGPLRGQVVSRAG